MGPRGRPAPSLRRPSFRAGRLSGRTALAAPALSTLLLMSACTTFVELSDAGRGVRVAQPDEVAGCRKLGTTAAKVLDRWPGLFLDRPATRVALELATLARNEAAEKLNGNAIVPVTPIEAGEQSWDVYRCSR